MFERVIKKAALVLSLLFLFTVVYSVIYNHPIRFQAKIMAYPRSVYSLNPSGPSPDQIIFCPAENPSRGIRLSWRTSPHIKNGEVRYWKSSNSLEEPSTSLISRADLTVLESPELRSDSVIHRFSAALNDLEPATGYQYQVGDSSTGAWSEIRNFMTAPEQPNKFSFVFFGDTQASPVDFGHLLEEIDSRYADTDLYLIAGDLVEDGEWRYMWDSFADSTTGIFSKKMVAPTLGNHDYGSHNGAGAKYFSSYFNVPSNGSPGILKGRNYSFNYENVCFIILDSNDNITRQAEWLERKLIDNSQAQFRIVMFHHPPYHPRRNRDDSEIQRFWLPLFDAYGVDLVLNGHDHSYLRTKKMAGHLPVPPGEDGVIYVTATACEKFYDFVTLPQAETQFGGDLTYQQISVDRLEADRGRLTFKAFDRQHRLRDEFVIEK